MAATAVFAVGSIIGFMCHKPVEVWLQKPLNQTLYYSNPAGGLSFVMQISMGVGILIALPMLLFQLMQFARPALKPIKTKTIVTLIATSLVLTVLGILYAYIISLPAALHFLTTFNSADVKALISVSDYMRFLFAYLMGTVIAFQLPLLLFFANKIRRFPPGGMLRLQRPTIVGSIIFAGVITPTVDPINQLLVAAPIVALFEIGAIAVVLTNRAHKPVPSFEIKQPAQLIRYVDPLVAPLPQSAPKPVTARAHVTAQAPIAAKQPAPRPQTRIIMDVLAPAFRTTASG